MGAFSGGAPGLTADKSLSGGVSFSPVPGSFGIFPFAYPETAREPG